MTTTMSQAQAANQRLIEESAASQLIDLTAQLRSQVIDVFDEMDGPSDRVIGHELPAPDPDFEMVHVSDDVPYSGCVGPWIVECNTGIEHADAGRATAYAVAIAAAARQACILNADGRVVSVPDDGRFSAEDDWTEPAPIVRMVEAGYDDHFRVTYDDTSSTPLSERSPGYAWRRDGYGFVYYGMFTWFGEELVDGRRRVLLKEAPRG